MERFTHMIVVIAAFVIPGRAALSQRHSAHMAIKTTGKTYAPLKHAEPSSSYEKHLKPSAYTCNDPIARKHPSVSLIDGEFSKDFLPTMVHGGTSEILLSKISCLHQVFDPAGQKLKTDFHEDKINEFQPQWLNSPEIEAALK